MFKKCVKVLFGLVLIWVGFFYGFLAHQHELFPYGVFDSFSARVFRAWDQRGRAEEPKVTSSDESDEDTRRQQLTALSQLGYLSGYEPPPLQVGVLTYDKQLAYGGYNFYVSTDGPKAHLMDMDGNELHTWSHPFQKGWPTLSPEDNIIDSYRHPEYWRRAHLFANGDVLAILEGTALIKVNNDSSLLWAYQGGFHHDLEVTDDGRILVLTRRRRPHHPDVVNRSPIIEDFITILSDKGELIEQVSLIDAIVHSRYRAFIGKVPPMEDILHTNTLEVLKGRLEPKSDAFRTGNVLVSFRNIDLIAVVDLEKQQVVWALTGMWKGQHQPTVLGNGNMLLFDNHGSASGRSQVMEFNPFTQEVAWAFEGNESNEFHSYHSGSNQRLANGNTLITHSTAGRVFEVTSENQIAWEWANPRRTDDEDRLISVVLEMLRIDYDFVKDWLD